MRLLLDSWAGHSTVYHTCQLAAQRAQALAQHHTLQQAHAHTGHGPHLLP